MSLKYPDTELQDSGGVAGDAYAKIGANGGYAAAMAERERGRLAALEEARKCGFEEGFKAAEAEARKGAYQRACAAAELAHDADKHGGEAAKTHAGNCDHFTVAVDQGPQPCGWSNANDEEKSDSGPKEQTYTTNINAFTVGALANGTQLVCKCGQDFINLTRSLEPAFLDAAGNCFCMACRPLRDYVPCDWLHFNDGDRVGRAIELRPLRPGEDMERAQVEALMCAYRARDSLIADARAAIEEARQESAAPARVAVLVALALASSGVGKIRIDGTIAASGDYVAGFDAAVEKSKAAIKGVIDILHDSKA